MSKHNDPAKPSKEFRTRLRKKVMKAAEKTIERVGSDTTTLCFAADEILRNTKARLHYYAESGFGWIEAGENLLYFEGDEEREKVETLGGDKVTKVSVRYDVLEIGSKQGSKIGLRLGEIFGYSEARLYYYAEQGCGWVELGGCRLYFLGDEEREKGKVHKKRKVTKVSVQYDGWEMG